MKKKNKAEQGHNCPKVASVNLNSNKPCYVNHTAQEKKSLEQ
jgi:hypothetical protein